MIKKKKIGGFFFHQVIFKVVSLENPLAILIGFNVPIVFQLLGWNKKSTMVSFLGLSATVFKIQQEKSHIK